MHSPEVLIFVWEPIFLYEFVDFIHYLHEYILIQEGNMGITAIFIVIELSDESFFADYFDLIEHTVGVLIETIYRARFYFLIVLVCMFLVFGGHRDDYYEITTEPLIDDEYGSHMW
jgi:hypothetical protein